MSILDFLNQSRTNANKLCFFYDFDTKNQNPCSSTQPTPSSSDQSHQHVSRETDCNLVQQKLIPALFPVIPSNKNIIKNNDQSDVLQSPQEANDRKEDSTPFVASRCHCCDLLFCAQNAISLDAGWCTSGDLVRNIAGHDATNNTLDFASRLDAVLKVQSFQENVGVLTQNDISSNIFMLGSKRNQNNNTTTATSMSRDEFYALIRKRRIAAMKQQAKNQQQQVNNNSNNSQTKQDAAEIFVSPSLQSSQPTQLIHDSFLEPFDLLFSLPNTSTKNAISGNEHNKNVADDGFLVPISFSSSSGGIPPKKIPNHNNNTSMLLSPTLKDESISVTNNSSAKTLASLSNSGVMMKLPPSLLLITKTKAPPPSAHATSLSTGNSAENNNNVFSKSIMQWNTKKMPNLVNSNFVNDDDEKKMQQPPSLPASKQQQFRSLLACEESEFDEEVFLKQRARERQKQQLQEEKERANQKIVNIRDQESFIDDNTLTDIDVKILLKREKEEAELKNTFFKFVVNSNNKNKNQSTNMMMTMNDSQSAKGDEDQTDSLFLQQDSSPMTTKVAIGKKNVFIPQVAKKSQEELDYFSGGDGVLNLKTGQITVPVQKTKKEPKPKKAPKEKKIAAGDEGKKMKKVARNKKNPSKTNNELPKRRARKENDESESSSESSDDSSDSDSDDTTSSSSSEETDSDDVPLVKMFKK